MTEERSPRTGQPRPPSSLDPRSGVETTRMLLQRAHDGDEEALDALRHRLLPRLQRWATGRLPLRARGVLDTADLVQDVLVRTLCNVEQIVEQHEGALAAYLRKVLADRIREELRHARLTPPQGDLDEETAGLAPSPLEELIGQDAFEHCEAALARLAPRDREVIVLRMELGMSHAEVAQALGLSRVDSACRVVARALLRLVREMGEGR